MIRRLKVLGLAALSVLAVTAVSASAAQAAPLGHVAEAPAIITGEQLEQHVFTTHAGTVKCSTADFNGTVGTTTFSTLTLNAKYETCQAFGFLNATVNMNGCDYLFHIVEGSSPATATVDVVCPTGKEIEVSSSGCKAFIPGQTGLIHVILSNTEVGGIKDIDANITISGISYKLTGFFCPGGAGSFNEGTYTGTATLRAYEDNGGVEGAQISGWVE